MKTIYILYLLFLTYSSFGQNDFNKINEFGKKMGKWIQFYENGKIKEINNYEAGLTKFSKEDLFFLGLDQNKDTLKPFEKLISSENYEYNDNWELQRIKKTDQNNNEIYLYGPNKEIGIIKTDYNLIGKVNTVESFIIEILNYSTKPLKFIPEFSSNVLTTNNNILILPPNQNSKIEFKLKIEPNENVYKISLLNDSVTINLLINTFGYHLESDDIQDDLEFDIENNFIYYRTGSEALLKIFDKEKKKELKTISLAKQRTNIDLVDLKPEQYWFCKIDFSNKIETYSKVYIKYK